MSPCMGAKYVQLDLPTLVNYPARTQSKLADWNNERWPPSCKGHCSYPQPLAPPEHSKLLGPPGRNQLSASLKHRCHIPGKPFPTPPSAPGALCICLPPAPTLHSCLASLPWLLLHPVSLCFRATAHTAGSHEMLQPAL